MIKEDIDDPQQLLDALALLGNEQLRPFLVELGVPPSIAEHSERLASVATWFDGAWTGDMSTTDMSRLFVEARARVAEWSDTTSAESLWDWIVTYVAYAGSTHLRSALSRWEQALRSARREAPPELAPFMALADERLDCFGSRGLYEGFAARLQQAGVNERAALLANDIFAQRQVLLLLRLLEPSLRTPLVSWAEASLADTPGGSTGLYGARCLTL